MEHRRLRISYSSISFLIIFVLVFNSSCIKFPKPIPNPYIQANRYLYPFSSEQKNITASISINLKNDATVNEIGAEIPPLKYNKSWLFLLSQDDTRHESFCVTWAAIHGKPIPVDKHYYDVEHLEAEDFPPGIMTLGKTLGSTDGAGKEVRFSFLITVEPEKHSMNRKPSVLPGFNVNQDRFKMNECLTFSNVKEMLNSGVGIAFHDVKTTAVDIVDSVKKHLEISQKILLDTLKGRGCKTLAEPEGNKVYIEAAKIIPEIQVITAQTEVEAIYPFQNPSALYNIPLRREPVVEENFRNYIEKKLALPKEQREAVAVFVHQTGTYFANHLLWLNNTYGKDGDDSMWAPSLEEYYEYNYYRLNGNVKVIKDNKTVKLEVFLPSSDYFYYPSVTINVKGLKMADIESVTSGDEVKGMSYADYKDGVMINIDCRKFLMEHATHYVEKYEKTKKVTDRADAIYFVKMLKESSAKRALLTRVGL